LKHVLEFLLELIRFSCILSNLLDNSARSSSPSTSILTWQGYKRRQGVHLGGWVSVSPGTGNKSQTMGASQVLDLASHTMINLRGLKLGEQHIHGERL
jgi:hypothetical protein